MARYGQTTIVANGIDDIDVDLVASRVLASAFDASAFLPNIRTHKVTSRLGRYVQEGTVTWGALAEITGATLPDEDAYVPTARAYTCTAHHVDVVPTQEALIDADTSGKSLEDQVTSATLLAYVSYFDLQFAGLYTEAPSSNPDHIIGSANDALTAGLIDNGIELLLTAKAKPPFTLVIYTGKIRELNAIPGVRDKMVRGVAGPGGMDGPVLGMNEKLLARGYGGVLDIYHSDQIVSSTGRHNMMFAVGTEDEHKAFANPWVEQFGPSGKVTNKLMFEKWRNGPRRVHELLWTTMEDFIGQPFSATTNQWVVDLVTA